MDDTPHRAKDDAPVDRTPDAPLDRALVEEAARKSGLVWVAGQALWHVWLDGAVCVVGSADGRSEQPLPEALTDGGETVVTVRSKDKGGRLVAFPARVTELPSGGAAWRAAADELKGGRLNAPDADTITERWARECRVLRLEPSGPLAEKPGAMPEDGGAAPPRPTAAITRRAIPAALPRLLLRRRGR